MTSSPSPRTESIGIEARESINAVFDALSTWRDEVAASTERFSELVLTKMTPAARAMGWPEELVEASRKQLAQVSKMQIQIMDQLTGTWQQQLNSPVPQFTAQLPLPGTGSRPASHMPDLAIAPAQFWMEAAEMWQRNWASALSMWAGPRGELNRRAARTH